MRGVKDEMSGVIIWHKYKMAKAKANAEAKADNVKKYWGNIYRIARNAYLDKALIAEKGDDVCTNGCYCHLLSEVEGKYKNNTGRYFKAICNGVVGEKCIYPKQIIRNTYEQD